MTYHVSWYDRTGQRHAYGITPLKALAAQRRVRRDLWLADRDPGWITTREQLSWSRLATRLGGDA